MSFWKKIFDKDSAPVAKTPDGDWDKTKMFVLDKKILPFKEAVPALLKVVAGENADLSAPVNSGRVNIGRMAGNELFLTDLSVSRLHAFVVNEDGHHILYDGKSVNGTFLNSQRITQKTLQHGDIIKIGNTVIMYELQ